MAQKQNFTLQLLFQHTRNYDSPIKLYSTDEANNHIEYQYDDFFIQLMNIKGICSLKHRVVANRLNSSNIVKKLSTHIVKEPEITSDNKQSKNHEKEMIYSEFKDKENSIELKDLNNSIKLDSSPILLVEPAIDENLAIQISTNQTNLNSNVAINQLERNPKNTSPTYDCADITKDINNKELSSCNDLENRLIKYSKNCVLVIEIDTDSIYELNFKMKITLPESSEIKLKSDANVIFSGPQLHYFSTNSNNYLMTPIFDNLMNPIGHLNCYFVILKPYINIQNFEKRLMPYILPPIGSQTLLVGHRGFGSSFCKDPSDFLENSFDSFRAANDFGIDFVEFDVQLTKDKTVVIFHDFEASPLIIQQASHDGKTALPSSPTNNHNSHSRNISNTLHMDNDPNLEADSYDDNDNQISSQSSLSVSIRDLSINQLRSLKFHNTTNGSILDANHEKPNEKPRKTPIGDMFPTLLETLNNLPSTLGFNIEVKSAQQKMDGLFESNYSDFDKNFFVDTILDDIYRSIHSDRRIYFSSFDPWICTLLKKKQSIFPVFFLFELRSSNFSGYVDARSHSIENALSFVATQKIDGLVVNIENIIDNLPIITKYIHSKSVRLFTYGDKNNDLDNILYQLKQNVDGVIFDDVAKIVPQVLPIINSKTKRYQNGQSP